MPHGPDASNGPAIHTVRTSAAGILTWGTEDLVVVPGTPEVGAAVCLASGGRLAFRRVLGISGRSLRLRADVAPFEDLWDGEVVGRVRPRPIDRLAALEPDLWTRANWRAAVVLAYTLAARRSLTRPRRAHFTTRLLDASEWSRVRAFWSSACGKELHVDVDPRQRVVGLFDGPDLVGANIHLIFGPTSYSAFTLVDRRYRGAGGGIKMLEHAVAAARAEGLESIYVHINARNLPSIRAYRRAGFENKGWWRDEADPLAAAERQWLVFEKRLKQ